MVMKICSQNDSAALLPVDRELDDPGAPSASRSAMRCQRRLSAWLVAAGLLMIPWLFILARQLPGSTRAVHWAAAWVGLDGMEAIGLVATGILLRRGDVRRCVTATVTATLLLVDAWFDVMTAASGEGRYVAIAMAAFGEVPLAVFCLALALASLSSVPPASPGASPHDSSEKLRALRGPIPAREERNQKR